MGLFSVEENKKIIALFDKMRTTDTRDGMDWSGMMHYGTMDYEIKPLWKTKTVGIALTVRFLPFEGPMPFKRFEEYSEWSNAYYKNICSMKAVREVLQEGDFIVMDQSNLDIGMMGSNNSLEIISMGAVGFVSNGGCRDTDEVILEKVPFWCRKTVQPMVQGRLRYDAVNIPVAVGGVTVHPGDVIVADGDGVVVVPRALALDVAKWGGRELANDKVGRRKLYEKMGMPLDETVI